MIESITFIEPEQGQKTRAVRIGEGAQAKTYLLDIENPSLFIRQLDNLGAALYREAKNNKGASISYKDALEAITPKKPSFKIQDESERSLLHAFNVCWDDASLSENKADHAKKLKANIKTSSRRNINLARQFLNAAAGYKAKKYAAKNKADLDARIKADEQLKTVEAAITGYETRLQKFLRYLGYSLGGIFALAQGGNNGKSMGASIIAIAAIAGIAGLTLGAPYIVIPALIIGVSSFVINALVAIKASGNTFANLFGRDKIFETLYNYRDETGNKKTFSAKQTAGFFAGGFIPTLFSAICLSALGGYVLMLTIASISALAAFAAPIAIAVTLSCATALFFVYLEDSSTLFHFNSEETGMTAVKNFLVSLVYPKKKFMDRVNAQVEEATKLLAANGEDATEAVEDYKNKLESRSKLLASIFIPLGLAGIGITMVGAAIAVPVLFPFISLPIAFIMATLAMPGQMPFYSGAAASLAGKVAVLTTKKPEVLVEAEKAKAAKEQAAAESSAEQSSDYSLQATRAAAKAQSESNASTSQKLGLRVKNALAKARDGIMATAKAGNPLGNGAIAMVALLGVTFINGVGTAIMLGSTFFLASFASASVGYTREANNMSTEDERFDNMFRGSANKIAIAIKEEPVEDIKKNKSKGKLSSLTQKASKAGSKALQKAERLTTFNSSSKTKSQNKGDEEARPLVSA